MLFLFPCLALAQKQSTSIAEDPMIKQMLDSCCYKFKSVDTIDKKAIPRKIKSYFSKISYSIFTRQGLMGADSAGNTFYIVLGYATHYVLDEVDYFYFDKNCKFIKRGTYFCDICF